ncbi:flavin reductase (DIM6/NTAB) family NADH-FMN oxidoreductase RutF [Paraburkholderia bannensis]|uniref:Flavin reductase (DIM6/NTAB) family NADH-FMN oxidoreductase RutF n=1 Tax=Paraburkholderia bannensis TaxID=765414 RepID=A0A7W9U3L1_9BURK|nr:MULTISPECIES: flavin reductase family protein [Paraburkholderia]MBB3261449.1 flavin reductase (DIM6/NTAB) family NADH-FMN oxidoreductase RutF [Paraburkholderia sp. WP4_3_2]MBB6106411.1 flavin reductase (DIM6/NTAB) family NADH-FMN oxidoreductase RutF [Paraburkholderia bannensis]
MDTLSRFKPVALEHASRLINHGPTVLITSADGTRQNVMAAAWSMPVEFTPPRIAVVIDKNTFTRELIHASGIFGICVPGAAAMDLTFAVGSVSGREGDKFAQFNIDAVKGPVLGLPLLEHGIAAWMECKLISEKHTEDAYDTCFCEVVSAAADPQVFSGGHWEFNDGNRDLHTIHHLGAGNFALASDAVKAKTLAG